MSNRARATTPQPIKSVAQQRRVSQIAFARDTGIHPRQVHRVWNGYREPNAAFIALAVEFFQQPSEKLFRTGR